MHCHSSCKYTNALGRTERYMVRMTVRCKREHFSVDDLKRLQLEFQEELSLFTSTKLKTPNSSNIKVIDERTIPDAAHILPQGLSVQRFKFSLTGSNEARRIPTVIRRASNPVIIRRIDKCGTNRSTDIIIHPHGCLVQGRKFSGKL